MKYDLSIDTELSQAFEYLQKLAESKSLAEIKKRFPSRSLRQNSYLHLLLGAFGQHFGYTLEESKQIYKEINKDLYTYTKNNRKFLRSSAELSKEDMAKSIDKLHKKSAEAGYTLPLATDQEWLRHIENQIEQTKYYL